MLVSVAAALLLLGYASFLSFRVGRLAQAAESALGPRGEIRAALPGSRSQDEIGALTRSFESLLGRLQDYTAYLRTLSSKLTHELRTPLAIVTTSLDNLEHEVDTPSGRDYMARLRQGAGRLDAILNSMGAATRVEQAVNEMPRAALDVAAVTGAAVDAYRDVYTDRRFELKVPGEPCMADGSVELIAQLLDKLVDNAVGFSTGGGQIDVSVAKAADGYELAVANEGPPLPAAMRYQLFDSLVSVRSDGDGNRPHLGLGLYIVAAIAKAHGGQVAAENRSDGRGVVVRVCLPRLR
jgi:signal transduction histidine kinase